MDNAAAPALRAWHRRAAAACCVLVAVLAMVVAAVTAPAATAPATVSVTVASAISMTNSCTTAASKDFGTVYPGQLLTTDTGANVCRITFSSSNDTAMLKVRQRDAMGTAMARNDLTTGVAVRAKDTSYQDVSAGSATVAWVVGGNGNILQTTDTGSTWATEVSGTGSTLYGVDAIDANNAYAVGSGKTIRKRAGSSTWNNQSAPVGYSGIIYGVGHVPGTPNTAWAVGAAGQIITTVNGGTTWTGPVTPTANDLYDIAVVDANTAYVVGMGGTILRTLNGGTTWTVVVSGVADDLQAVTATSASTIYVAGSSGEILKSTNANAGSPTFTNVAPDTTAGLVYHGVKAFAGGTVYASTQSDEYKSTDSGATWNTIADPSDGNAQMMDGWAAAGPVYSAHSGRIVIGTTDGNNWTVMSAATGDVRSVATYDDLTMIAVAGQGFIYRSTDGGVTWGSVTSPTTNGIKWVVMPSATVAYAVAASGQVLKSTDAGATWNIVGTPTGNTLMGVYAPDASTVVVVGLGGVIRRSADGGATWTSPASGTGVNLNAITGADATNMWAFGNGGTIIKSSDGGVTWGAQASGVAYDFNAGSTVDGTTVFASGATGGLRTTTNGGTTWSAVANPVTSTVRVTLLNNSDIWIGGGSSTQLYHSADGGSTWTSITVAGAPSAFYQVLPVDENTVIVTAATGYIGRISPAVTVPDFASGTTDWTTPAGGSMFGVCLQAIGGSTVADWTKDPSPPCAANNGHPWRAVPVASQTIAHTTAAGATGSVDLVWGLRVGSTQQAGTYYAPLLFDAIAPWT